MFEAKKPKAFHRHINTVFHSPYRNRAVHLSRLMRLTRFDFSRWSQLFGRLDRFRFASTDHVPAYGRH